jgi:ribosomal protein S18 acetylase RimI-like enzyme
LVDYMIEYWLNPTVTNEVLNALFAAAWENHPPSNFERTHAHSLLYVGAFARERLVGYVNVAWDGGVHGFILDTTVHPEFQRRGIGVELVREAADAARARGIQWLHVDYEPHLEAFYQQCGFTSTLAGLLRLND